MGHVRLFVKSMPLAKEIPIQLMKINVQVAAYVSQDAGVMSSQKSKEQIANLKMINNQDAA